MKKEDQFHRNNQQIEPQFEDASYQQDMRVDPLTTMDAIKRELREIEDSQKQRSAEKDEQKRLEEEQTKKEFEEFKAEKLKKEGTADGKEDDAGG